MHLLGLLNFANFVSTAGYSAVFTLCLLQSCCVPTSSELTLGFAGVLAAQGKLSLAGIIVVGVLGEVAGAYVAWVVGRYAGRAVVDRFGRYLLLSHRDLDRAEAWYDGHQRFGVFGSRLLPVIRNFAALPAGIAEVPLMRFGFLTAAGSLVWVGASAGVGYGVGSHWHAIASGFGDVGYALAVVGAGAIAFAVHHRYRSYKEAISGGQAAPGSEEELSASGLRNLKGVPTTGPDGSSRRWFRRRESANDKVRWVTSSSGRPPAEVSTVGVARGSLGTDRRVTSSSGRPPVARAARREFPNSPIAAWEAAVLRGRTDTEARFEPLVDKEDEGVEANGRLTAMLGALLFVLLAVEGVTILHVGALLTLHVLVGMVLVPVVLLKIGSTTWRFARYYLGSPEYRRKGPPPPVLRLLGPFVVVSTVAVVGSGIALLLAPTNVRNELLLIHKVTFVLWFAAMVVHVLGHLLDTARLAPRDFYWRTRRQVRGASMRQWAITSAVCIGILLAVAVAPKVAPWLHGGIPVQKGVSTHSVTIPADPSHRHR